MSNIGFGGGRGWEGPVDVAAPCDISCDSDVTVSQKPSQEPPATTVALTLPSMAIGDVLFGITCTGNPIGRDHWLADSSVCGDMVMALPSSVLIAARTKEGGGVAVDMMSLLDAIPEGVGKFNGLAGVAEAAALPVWCVCRIFGTFPVLRLVYDEAMDNAALIVEGAAHRAAIGMTVVNTRKMVKSKRVRGTPTSIANAGEVEERDFITEVNTESLTKQIMPDAVLSKLILTSRMKGRYKDEGGMRQAVQINITGAESRL